MSSCSFYLTCRAILACRQEQLSESVAAVSKGSLGALGLRGGCTNNKAYRQLRARWHSGSGWFASCTSLPLTSDEPLAMSWLWSCHISHHTSTPVPASAHHLGTLSSTSAARSPYQQSAVGGHGSEPSADARTKQSIATFCIARTVSIVTPEGC